MRLNETAVPDTAGIRMLTLDQSAADGVDFEAAMDTLEPLATVPPHLSPAYRKAAALLSIYRSRIDYLNQR